MKNILAILLLSLIVIFTSSCISVSVENEQAEESMFVIVERASGWRVVYHKETKVMYVISSGSSNYSTFTLLVDEYGNPLLWGEEK